MVDQNQQADQHTVPKFYLTGFLDPGSRAKRLEIFSKQFGRWLRKAPKSAAVVKHFYSLKQPDGLYDTSIETWLNESVENPAVIPFRRLARGECVSGDQRSAIAMFIGLLLVRTTKIRETQRSLDRFMSDPRVASGYVERSRQNLLRLYPESEVDDFLRKMNDRNYGLKLPQNWFVKVLAQGIKYGHFIETMNWQVEVTNQENPFITSDNPAFVCVPRLRRRPCFVGLARDDLGSELCFPLSSTAYFRASYNQLGPERLKASQTRVAELNRRVVAHATDFVICPKKSERIEAIVESEKSTIVLPLDPVATIEQVTGTTLG